MGTTETTCIACGERLGPDFRHLPPPLWQSSSPTQTRPRWHAVLPVAVLVALALTGKGDVSAVSPPATETPAPVTYVMTGRSEPGILRVIPRATAAPTALPTPVAPPLPTPVAPVEPPIPIVAVHRVLPGTGVLAWPVSGPITTYFSAGHAAIDISAAHGTPVLAAAAGTVMWAGWKTNGGGLVVDVSHPGGLVTSYNHLGSVSVGPGQEIVAGQQVGAVGCTGLCTGPHLHFAVSASGAWVDPLTLL